MEDVLRAFKFVEVFLLEIVGEGMLIEGYFLTELLFNYFEGVEEQASHDFQTTPTEVNSLNLFEHDAPQFVPDSLVKQPDHPVILHQSPLFSRNFQLPLQQPLDHFYVPVGLQFVPS